MPAFKTRSRQAFYLVLRFTMLLLLGLVLLTACKRSLPKKEAEKYLKAFDNELIILFNQLSESEGLFLLNRMLAVENLPLPLLNLVASNKQSEPAYRLANYAGIYRVDTLSMLAQKVAPSDSLVVLLPYRSKKAGEAFLVLSSFEASMTKWGTEVPTKMELKLGIDDRVLFAMHIDGEIKHDIPVKMNVEMQLAQYLLQLKLRSLLTRQRARFFLNIAVLNGERNIVKAKSYMQHDVSNPGASILEKTKVRLVSFPVDVKVRIDNLSIDPHSNNFVKEFNQNTSITVRKQNDKTFLGTVALKEREGEARLNYALTYSDGSLVFLDELMLSYKYLMNLRYPDVPVSRR